MLSGASLGRFLPLLSPTLFPLTRTVLRNDLDATVVAYFYVPKPDVRLIYFDLRFAKVPLNSADSPWLANVPRGLAAVPSTGWPFTARLATYDANGSPPAGRPHLPINWRLIRPRNNPPSFGIPPTYVTAPTCA